MLQVFLNFCKARKRLQSHLFKNHSQSLEKALFLSTLLIDQNSLPNSQGEKKKTKIKNKRKKEKQRKVTLMPGH